MPRSESLPTRGEPLAPRGDAMPRAEPMVPRESPVPRNEPSPARAEPLMPRPPAPPIEPPARAPMARPAERATPAAAPAVSAADQNLAEMAQRLEAALRRPAAGDPIDRAPPVAPESPGRPAPQRTVSDPLISSPATAAGAKISLDNLEDEMANLLGRPKTPT
jgi:hypothetical protein